MELTKSEQEFLDYATKFIAEEQQNNFGRVLEDDLQKDFLHTYAYSTLNVWRQHIAGLESFPHLENFIIEEIYNALLVGYGVKEANNRFFLERPEYQKDLEEKKKKQEEKKNKIDFKLKLKEGINTFLDRLKIQ
ncbi:MAG: hypothetical protein ACOC1K_04600 [Nanoarchaeota archaeon]